MQRHSSNHNNNNAGGFRGLESLEGRAMFNTVPVLAPFVVSAEFDDSRAPHELRVRFSSDVSQSLDASDITLINEQGRFVFPGERLTINWDAATNTAHFVFIRAEGGVLPEGTWHATLIAEGITDAEGIALDGDGDELPGGNAQIRFEFNQADANHDGAVDLSDFNIIASNFGQSGRSFREGDLDYSGRVDLNDFRVFAARFSPPPDAPRPGGAFEKAAEATTSSGGEDRPTEQISF